MLFSLGKVTKRVQHFLLNLNYVLLQSLRTGCADTACNEKLPPTSNRIGNDKAESAKQNIPGIVMTPIIRADTGESGISTS